MTALAQWLVTLFSGGGGTSLPSPDLPTLPVLSVIFPIIEDVELVWTASTVEFGHTVQYNLRRDGVLIFQGPDLTFTDTDVTPGQQYSYTIEAVDITPVFPVSSGESAPRIVDVPEESSNQPPSKPTGLTAGTVTANSVPLSWTAATDPDGTVTSYNLRRNGVLLSQPTGTSYTDNAVNPSTSYTYTIEAVDNEGALSGESSPLAVVTPTAGGSDPYTLASGGDLAAAISAASSGSTIVLQAGGTYNVSPGSLGNNGKNLTIRTQNAPGALAIVRSGNGTGNYVHLRDRVGRYRFLPQYQTHFVDSRAQDPNDTLYIGPHLNTNGTIDLTRVKDAKFAGEDLHDWPAGANPNDYTVLRGQGGTGFDCTGGSYTLKDLQIYGFNYPLHGDGGTLNVERCAVIGGKNLVDMEGSVDINLTDSFFTGGAQSSWSWRDVKSYALDFGGTGKRTWVLNRDNTGILTVRRCTVWDVFDGVVGNPSYTEIDVDQLTIVGPTDDLTQVQADTHGDILFRRSYIHCTSFGGSTNGVGPNGVSVVFDRCIMNNFRQVLDYGIPRWRILLARHQLPFDPVDIKNCLFIERGGTNSNNVVLNFELGAPYGGTAARPQKWTNVAIAYDNTAKLGRDYDRAAAGGLIIDDTAILNMSGQPVTFRDGNDFATWKTNSGDSTAEVVNSGLTPDDIAADPRLVSQAFGRDVGAVAAAASKPFSDIGDPNEWGTGRASLLAA